MRVVFANKKLERLAHDRSYTWKYSQEVAEAYRLRLQALESAGDVRDVPHLGSVRLEKLKGSRRRQWSMRLTGPWRLVLQFRRDEQGQLAVVIEVVDYHR